MSSTITTVFQEPVKRFQNFSDYPIAILTLLISIIVLVSGAINLSLINEKGTNTAETAVPGAYGLAIASIVIGALLFLFSLVLFYQAYNNNQKQSQSELRQQQGLGNCTPTTVDNQTNWELCTDPNNANNIFYYNPKTNEKRFKTAKPVQSTTTINTTNRKPSFPPPPP